MKGKYKRRREKARPVASPGVEVCISNNVVNPLANRVNCPLPVREFTRSEVLKAERRGTFLGLLAVVVVVTALIIGVS